MDVVERVGTRTPAPGQHATPEDLPPEMHLAIMEYISSATDLKNYVYASPYAASVFLEHRGRILVDLLERILTPEALVTGIKIHCCHLSPAASDITMGLIHRYQWNLRHLDEPVLSFLYLLCLRHEPMVFDTFGPGWRKTATGKQILRGMRLWWRSKFPKPYPVYFDRHFEALTEKFPKRYLAGLFTLKLLLPADESKFKVEDHSQPTAWGGIAHDINQKACPSFDLDSFVEAFRFVEAFGFVDMFGETWRLTFRNHSDWLNTQLVSVALNEQLLRAIKRLRLLRRSPRRLAWICARGSKRTLLPQIIASYGRFARSCLRTGGSAIPVDCRELSASADEELTELHSFYRLIDAFNVNVEIALHNCFLSEARAYYWPVWNIHRNETFLCYRASNPVGLYKVVMAQADRYIRKRGDTRWPMPTRVPESPIIDSDPKAPSSIWTTLVRFFMFGYSGK